MKTEEKREKLKEQICAMIKEYGPVRFADALIKWYGCRNLYDAGELNEIKQLI